MTPAALGVRTQEALDRTIQQLFGIGLKLEYSMQLIDESPEQARDCIDSTIASIGQVINELRGRMERRIND